MSAGFVVSAEMARRRDLGCAAKLVYAYAARYVTTDDRETGKPGGLEVGEVWLRQRKRTGERPGVDAALGLSHGAVERAIKDLTEAGLLVVTRTPTPAERRSGQVTVYRLPEYSPRNGDWSAADHSPERGSYSPRNGDGTAPETGTYCSEGIGSDESVDHTPPTPLAEGGAVEVIEGTIEDGDSPTTDPLRGYRWPAALTRRGGAPTEQERAQAAEVFEAWIASPEILGGRRRTGAVLNGRRMEYIVHRLRDGYGVDDLADACRGWTCFPHNRGENERGTKYDGIRVVLADGDQVERFRDAWRDQHDPTGGIRQAALMRQATRNPMLAAAAAVAPEGLPRDPRNDPDVRDALDAARRAMWEDHYRRGVNPPAGLTPEREEEVIREALAARAVPC